MELLRRMAATKMIYFCPNTDPCAADPERLGECVSWGLTLSGARVPAGRLSLGTQAAGAMLGLVAWGR